MGCTHLIQAVGYESSALPPLSVDGVAVPADLWQTARLQPRETLRGIGFPTLQLGAQNRQQVASFFSLSLSVCSRVFCASVPSLSWQCFHR